MSTDKVIITESDKQNPLWRKLQDYWAQRLDVLRKKNDCDRDEKATATLRGQIAEVKSMMSLDNPPPNQD